MRRVHGELTLNETLKLQHSHAFYHGIHLVSSFCPFALFRVIQDTIPDLGDIWIKFGNLAGPESISLPY